MYPDFSKSSLREILLELENNKKDIFSFLVLNPDIAIGLYAGEEIEGYRYRSYKSWFDLAYLSGYRLLTPEKYNDELTLLRFQKLLPESFHQDKSSNRYSPKSQFARIRKNEEPSFYIPYTSALKRIDISSRKEILSLGLNRGDELEPIFEYSNPHITGIDIECFALNIAKERFSPYLTTHCMDLNKIDSINLGKFDLIISIGTLQSPSINMKKLIMDLVQKYLKDDGAILLGWPNSRWIDGELIYGAKVKNYNFSELSLVIKDLFWIKKYLQQHKFKVAITGREYLFLEAVKI